MSPNHKCPGNTGTAAHTPRPWLDHLPEVAPTFAVRYIFAQEYCEKVILTKAIKLQADIRGGQSVLFGQGVP